MDGPVAAVLKVGGSFLRYPDARSCVVRAVHREAERVNRLLVLAGGGEAADLVRRWQERWGLTDEQAHWLAIAAMDLNAELLARCWLPRVPLVEKPGAGVEKVSGVAIIRPTTWISELEEKSALRLPRSWEVTSDALAWFIAMTLEIPEVILLKHLEAGADRVVDSCLDRLCGRYVRPMVRLLDPRTGESVPYRPRPPM